VKKFINYNFSPEVVINFFRYYFSYDPDRTFYLFPTEKKAEKFMKERIEPNMDIKNEKV